MAISQPAQCRRAAAALAGIDPARVYALRHIFAPSGWLHTSERFIAIMIWSGLALYLTGFCRKYCKRWTT